jgi:signal transduction histidine kinase
VVSRLADSDAARVEVFLDPALVRVDAIRIERVIENLLHNALKYSSAPSAVVIRLEAVLGFATMSIVDAGPGLSTEEIQTVFDRHRRGEAARGSGGFGIGLYASRRMIEAHGGRLWVESVVGSGARFYFELPIAPPAPKPPRLSGRDDGERTHA